jgi:hypothetical protein
LSRTFPRPPSGYLVVADAGRQVKAIRTEWREPVAERKRQKNRKNTRQKT